MSRREIIAYAITHAPPGVKGGPYTGNGSTANQVPSMALARRYALEDLHEAQADVAWLVRNEYTARVIRIVRAPPSSPSEASAIAVLRELVAWDETPTSCGLEFGPIADRARRVLAGAGPDPMRVVGAALEETAAEEAEMKGRLIAAREARRLWVGSYRKAGGK